MDGSEPTKDSMFYEGSFTVTTDKINGETITVKAIGIKSGYTNSAVATKIITFKEKEEPGDPEAAKAAFLGYLAEEVKGIEVANVAIDEEDITVTFKEDADPSDVLQAATALVNTLKGKLDVGTLNFEGREGEPFDLKTEGVAINIAEYLLGDTKPADFIAKKMTIAAKYTASITDEDGVDFGLAGTVTFTVAGAIEAEINALTEEKLKPAFKDFATVINKQSPKTIPPYRLWVEYDIDDLEVTFIFSEEVQKMDPYTGLRTAGLKTAFYSLVDVPEIQGVSVGENGVKFKDEAGNPRSGQGFENELMFFGARLVSADGNIPITIGEVIGKDQAMDLDCETSSGIAFQLGISFHFEAAKDQEAPTSLKGVTPTSQDNNDGKITGVDDTMEYRIQGEDKWTKVEKDATRITSLTPGTYHVRYAAKPGYNASAAVEVIVPEYEAPVVAAEVERVEAENGKVTITLKEKPTTAPTAEDFSATIAIDGEETTELTLSDFAIDEDGVTITFNFEAVEQTEAEQSVVVAVKLGEGDEVAAKTFTVEADDLLAKEAAKRAFYETAKENYELYDEAGDTLVANVTFSAKTNAITVRFQDMEPMNVFTAASEFFLTILLEDLGVQEVAFEHDQFLPLSNDLDEILLIAEALFEKMGVDPLEVLQGIASFNGIEVPFAAKIQPQGHVEYEDEFTVAFYDESKED